MHNKKTWLWAMLLGCAVQVSAHAEDASVLPSGSVPVAVFSNATDADFAMLAANCHDGLVAALTTALPELEANARFLRDMQAHAGQVTKAFDAAATVRAALAKAKGGAS